MADEIKQVLGIDATQALEALKQLDRGYLTFEDRIKSVAGTLDDHNRRSKQAIADFKEMASAANAAAKALAKVNKAQSGGGSTSSRSTTRSSSTPSKTKLLSGADAADAFNKLLGKSSQEAVSAQLNAERQLLDSVRRVAQGTKSNLGEAEQATKSWTISWETLSRVVVTQLIVRALSQIRDLLRESVSDAIQFQKQIALITTIADGASFDQIAEGVRKISDNFNLPLLETAAGVYNALSNQVGNFEESLRFTEDAAKFAKATNSSLADSVDLLSAALRSYGLGVEDTAKVSAIFFTAIDKGRVTADQLSNSIGRILEPASEIGIELEELSGAVAAVSEKGLGTAETLTQFRGIVTALTKPTAAMREELRGLGFDSSRAAIETLGLDGVLDSLARSTGGSAEEFARLFPNVRGLGGALGVTGENLEFFRDNIREARQNGVDFAQSKFMQATATDAEQLTASLNKVSNAFTLELGNALVEAGNDLIQAMGGVDVAIENIKELGNAIRFVSGTIASLEKFSGILSGLAKLSPLTVFSANLKQDIENNSAGIKELQTQHEASAKAFAKAEAERIDKLTEANKEATKIVRTQLQALGVDYLKSVADAERGDQRMVDSAERTLDKIVDLRADFLKAIESAITDSVSQIEQSQERIFAIQQGQEDRKFERKTTGFSDAQKVAALTQRSAELARQAEATLQQAFKTGNDALKQRALSLFGKASSTAEDAKQIGERTKNRTLEANAAKAVEDVATRQLNVEREINAQQEIRRQRLIKERAEQEKIVERLKEQAKIVLENSAKFDKDGNRFSEKEAAAREQRKQAALLEVGKAAFSSKDLKVADFLGLADFSKSFQNSVAKDPIKLTFEVDQEAKAAQARVQQVFNGIDIKLPFLKSLEDALGRPLRKSTEDINKGLTEINSQAAALEKQKSEAAQTEAAVAQRRAEVQELIKQLELGQSLKRGESEFFGNGEPNDATFRATEAAIASLKRLLDNAKLTKDEIQELENTLSETDFGRTGFVFDTGAAGTPQDAARNFKAALEALRAFQTEQANLKTFDPVDQAKLEQLQGVIQSFQTTQPDVRAANMGVSLGNAVAPADTVALAASNTASAYERAAAAILSVQGATLPQVPVAAATAATASHGRHLVDPKYMAGGGFTPRGMDTIPVMARAGESIINPDSTRKFFSQIQAINAGKQPIFRSQGGGVTNVGDISINVNGSGSPEQTGRTVIRKLRREFRRGTSRL